MSTLNIASEFNSIVEKAKARGKRMRVAVAGANVENILHGVFKAQEDGFVEPVLVGSYKKITAMVEALGYADRDYDLQPVGGDTNVVQYAIELVNSGGADALMRGNTQTRDFLLPVLNKANHMLREDNLLTHVVVTHIPGYPKLLFISDVTLIVDPSIEERKHIIRNMVRATKVFGITDPKIALLSLVEKPSFHMRDTVEAQTIVNDHADTPIAACQLVGPISYDLTISKEAARLKGYDCPYSGEFDGLVVPHLMVGNVLLKALEFNAGATSCGLLMGARVPVAITGRSEGVEEAYLSLAACASMLQAP